MAQKGPTSFFFFFFTFQVLIFQIGAKRIGFGKIKLQIQFDQNLSTPKSDRWTFGLFDFFKTDTVYIRIKKM